MDKNSTVLSIALKHDMEVFATLKPRSKYVSIAKNIIEYQKSRPKKRTKTVFSHNTPTTVRFLH